MVRGLLNAVVVLALLCGSALSNAQTAKERPTSTGDALRAAQGNCLYSVCLGTTLEDILKLGPIRWTSGSPSGRVDCKGEQVSGVLTQKNGTRLQVSFSFGDAAGPVPTRYRLRLVSLPLPIANQRDAELELYHLAKRNGMEYFRDSRMAAIKDRSGVIRVLAQLLGHDDSYQLVLFATVIEEQDWLRTLPDCR